MKKYHCTIFVVVVAVINRPSFQECIHVPPNSSADILPHGCVLKFLKFFSRFDLRTVCLICYSFLSGPLLKLNNTGSGPLSPSPFPCLSLSSYHVQRSQPRPKTMSNLPRLWFGFPPYPNNSANPIQSNGQTISPVIVQFVDDRSSFSDMSIDGRIAFCTDLANNLGSSPRDS